jgi:hypothetical protein
MNLEILESVDGYRYHFMDPALWEGYVRQVCAQHFNNSPAQVRPGLAGSFPTFIVDERWVVKFFGRLFEGERDYETEVTAGRLLAADPLIPVPAILASGSLFSEGDGWPWPYLVFQYIPGVSFGEVYDQVPLHEKLAVARQMGETARRIHRLPLTGSGVFPAGWHAYLSFLQAQRAACVANHRQWGSLPERLVDQLDDFLLPVEDLLDLRLIPHLIHADLTGDHLLGCLENDRWTTLGLIDFGDAMTGSLFYELVALHLDLFRSDKRLLRAFLEAYAPPAWLLTNFARRAMTATLLHRFDVLVLVFREPRRRVQAVASLEELARALWDLNEPGVSI